MFKLLKYMKEHIVIAILAPVFKLCECLLELLVPLILANIIDYGIKNNDSEYVYRMCIIMMLLAIVGFLFALCAQYFAAKSAGLFVKKIKNETFNHIQHLSFSQLDQLTTSTLINRMSNDMNQIQTGVNLALRLLLRSPIIVLGSMIMAFTIDSKQAMIFVVIIPILAIVTGMIMYQSLPLYNLVQNKLDKLLKSVRENLVGTRVIRAFNIEELEIKEFKDHSNELKQENIKVGIIASLLNPLTYILINLAIVILFYTGAIRVSNNSLSSGQVVALYNYMSAILVELIKLTSLIITISKTISCGNRVQEILDIKLEDNIDKVNEVLDEDTIVEFKNVSLNYCDSQMDAIEDISFKVKKGQTVGIIGSTGSGKSSIVNMIPGFYEANKGEVLINGVNVSNLNKDELRKRIAFVFQKAALFKGNIRSNLLLGDENATDEELIKALKASQSYEFVMDKDGLDSIVEEGGSNYSGGQKQRLNIARALVRKPEILILDDSYSALDYLTEKKVRDSINKLSYHPTIFIVSQRTSSIKKADLIIVMDDGKMVGIGKHQDLLKNNPIYQEIYYSQYPKELVNE